MNYLYQKMNLNYDPSKLEHYFGKLQKNFLASDRFVFHINSVYLQQFAFEYEGKYDLPSIIYLIIHLIFIKHPLSSVFFVPIKREIKV